MVQGRDGGERERAQATDGSRQREIFIIALHYVIEHRVGGKSGGGVSVCESEREIRHR